MCEITNHNFYRKFSDIVDDITDSDFIAIDCEFSGILKQEDNLSLFDEPADRYNKMRKGMEDFVSLQTGISVFTYKGDGVYTVSTYVFYLFPRSYPYGPECFSCDARSLQFLGKQKFDFNRVVEEGITYVRISEIERIEREIDDGSLLIRMKSNLSKEDRYTIQSLCSTIGYWKMTAEEDEYIDLNVSGFEPFMKFILRDHIEKQYSVVTASHGNHEIRIRRGTRDEDERKEELLCLVLGFTRLMKEIIRLKKPVIGHNMFTDLLIIYKMFVSPLPHDYNAFKKEILKVFPTIFDTKFLSFELKRLVGKRYFDTPNALIYLYKYFENDVNRLLLKGMPIMRFEPTANVPRPNLHDSGYDSYCTGFVFLKIAHMFSMWDRDENKFATICIGNNPVRYFGIIRTLKNRINMMRCKVGYIFLSGPDPESDRPQLLLLESKVGPVDIFKISDSIAKYDAADVKPLNSRQALIAASSEATAKMIRKFFAKNKNYKLSTYRPTSYKIVKTGLVALSILGVAGMISLFCFKRIWKQNPL